MLELGVGWVGDREKFVYDLRFLRLPLAQRFPLQLRIGPYGLGWKIPLSAAVPDSF